jgi:hypothetical protein
VHALLQSFRQAAYSFAGIFGVQLLFMYRSNQASSPRYHLKASPSSKDASKTIMVIKSNAGTLLEPIFFFVYCLNSNGLAFSIATN